MKTALEQELEGLSNVVPPNPDYNPGGGGGGGAGSDTDALHKQLFDAKGDLIVGTGNDAGARVAAGTNGFALVADSSQAGGVRWAALVTALHAATHAAGGTDALTLTSAQISDLSAAITAGITTWVGAAPGSLDTLVEIANRLAADESDEAAALINAVALEVTNRNTAISTAIGTEVTNRNAAISSGIASEATARDTAISTAANAAQAAAIAASAQVLTPTAVKTANFTAAAGDFVPVDTTSGSVTITFPTAPADKSRIGLKHVIQGAANVVNFTLGGSDVFNKVGGVNTGSLSLVNQAVQFQYKASTGIWYAVADDIPLSGMDLRFLKRTEPAIGQASANMTHLTAVNFLGMLNHTGAPVAGDLTSGTFPTGGQVYDSAGQAWLCTAGGSPGTWIAVGSGRLLASVRSTVQFVMTTAATVEDVATMNITFTFDGRPVNLKTTPFLTQQDVAASKLITASICRSSDNAMQANSIRQTDATVGTLGTPQVIETGPFTAWPSDGAALVVGTAYTVKMRILSGASSKATINGGNVQSYSLYAVTM